MSGESRKGDHLRKFIEEFNAWAPTYDLDVRAERWPFSTVFDGYHRILSTVAWEVGAAPGRTILDVGTGTGNLARYLLTKGARVVAVDPSQGMRAQAANKLPGVPIFHGHFLDLPFRDRAFDGAVTSYAFHHLTDDEKAEGISNLLRVVRPGGRVVIADIAFADDRARQRRYEELRRAGHAGLVEELEREYYTTVDRLKRLFAEAGARPRARQVTAWVWAVAGEVPIAAAREDAALSLR